jgi:hypothetical protein
MDEDLVMLIGPASDGALLGIPDLDGEDQPFPGPPTRQPPGC